MRSWIKLPAHPFVRTEGTLLTHPLQNCCLHTPSLSQGQAQCLHKPRLKNKAIGFRVQWLYFKTRLLSSKTWHANGYGFAVTAETRAWKLLIINKSIKVRWKDWYESWLSTQTEFKHLTGMRGVLSHWCFKSKRGTIRMKNWKWESRRAEPRTPVGGLSSASLELWRDSCKCESKSDSGVCLFSKQSNQQAF